MDEYVVIINILRIVYSGKNLNEALSLISDKQNRAKIKNICYGVIRNYYVVNFIINKLVTKVKEFDKVVLQIGIFELKYSKKPEYAIINDLVELNYSITKNTKSKNFINAVLREYLRQAEILNKNIEADYSLKYNLPNWIIDKLKFQDKQTYLNILIGLSYHPAFGIRINYNKITLDSYLDLLIKKEIKFVVIDSKICLLVPCNVEDIPLFNQGVVSIQDIAAQYSVDILKKNKVKPKLILDACSAPGGKACQILENYNEVDLLAMDNDTERLKKVRQNLERLNLSAKTIVGDARNKKWWNGTFFDFILADVPCSASGTIKRNPDIKINRNKEDIEKFVTTQREIVVNLWDMLEVNGYLLYVTCSLFSEENQNNVKWFIENLPNSELIDEIQVLPDKYSDSLYYALIRKIS